LKILIIDNYDSFTYNLLHYVESFDVEVTIVLNDKLELHEVKNYDKIILSPGPGLPKDAGITPLVIASYFDKIPILGVCLGFQAIIEHFGGTLYNQPIVKHGVAETGHFVNSSKLFRKLPASFKIGLYHSWAARKENFPEPLTITAHSEEDVIMAFEHKELPICGVQFHPESILSENGHAIVENFLFNFD